MVHSLKHSFAYVKIRTSNNGATKCLLSYRITDLTLPLVSTMENTNKYVAKLIDDFDESGTPVRVSLSNELVTLLSEQLYQSPVKAIEELVVNAYDAEAQECHIFVPMPDNTKTDFIVLFDDGIGMNRDGLVNLWQIGRSNKRSPAVASKHKRKQIGRFGIGKLASYSVANRLTYVTKSDNKILSVTIDFRDFLKSPTGASEAIDLPVRDVGDWVQLAGKMQHVLDAACIAIDPASSSWTLVILEELKREKTQKLTPALLTWILSTAMPLKDDFRLFLNCEAIVSSKETYSKVVEFGLADISTKPVFKG